MPKFSSKMSSYAAMPRRIVLKVAGIRSLRVGSTIWDILHRRQQVTGLVVDGMRLWLAAPPGQTEELQQFLTRLPAPLVQLSNSDIALSGLPLISPEGFDADQFVGSGKTAQSG